MMIKVYYNYPRPRMRMHANLNCSAIEKSGKAPQRKISINRDSQRAKLIELKDLTFASDKSQNDLWLTIDFGNVVEEEAEAKRILRTLGEHYTRFLKAEPIVHCSRP